ncbi:right-handed parallel beta-helix repeat-containing protein [Echinicola shivajiensis]|uniref:right-handed parallel beta-helix repeat-containing protein n=1 Tax=Echinicola shivajiensis TaxID=1035916 RepID=UPI001BFCBCFE|nr:right-handed parallel beta-helix repeat-containing protein [Echinicola shivajiensis]
MKFKKITAAFLSVFCISLMSKAQDGKTFYVSPSGSDKNAGTVESPFASITKAKAVIKDFKEENSEDQVNLILREGTYYLQEPLVFGPIESGNEAAPYIIRAEEGKEVVLSGGKVLELKWKTYENEILVAKVPKGLQFSSLFIKGQKQIRARYPNYQEGVYPYSGFAEDALSKERIDSWNNPTGGFIHALHSGRWGGMHYVITGKNADGTLAYEGGWQNNRESEMHKSMRFVENIFEELDAPGEWYLDTKKSLLYYYPNEGMGKEDIGQVEIAVLENLVTLKGEKDHPVQYISFEGIEFTHTAPTFMKTEEQLMRSDWTIYRGGTILMDGTENCSVTNSVFRNLGGNAIFVSNYNRQANISSNLIEEIGGSAISFVGGADALRSPSFNYHEFVEEENLDTIPGPKTANYPSNSTASDNLIRNIGLIEKQVAGVQIQLAMDLHISHNTIYDVPRAGINIGDGAWGGHIIEYNDVFNTVMETGDHGAFNSWGRDRYWHPNRSKMNDLTARHPEWIRLDAIKTTIIRNNRFHCDHGWDIDLDDGSSNYEIYNNLCLSGGLKLREGFYRTVYNNITVNNGFHPHVWFKESHDVFTRNIVMTAHKQIRVDFWGDKVDENFFTAASDLSKTQEFGVDASSESGNPLFVAPEEGDFRVQTNSPAKTSVGFENFDMDEFGVVSPVLKSKAGQPKIPDLLLERKEEASKVYGWHGFKLKKVETLGEQSAAGLNEIAGILVLEVPNGYDSSDMSKLQKGDVILSSWGDEVNDVMSLQKAEKGNAWKGRVELEIWRNQSVISITIPK